MVKVRKFTLVNAKGARMPLSSHNEGGIFGINPKGLGIGFDIDSDNFQSASLITSIRTSIPVFEVSVTFGMNYALKSARELVFDTIRFLDASPYRLEYDNDNGTYYKDCVLQEFPMTDLSEGVVITQAIKFFVTSLWYQNEVIVGVDNPLPIVQNAGKIFVTPKSSTDAEPLFRRVPYVYSDMTREDGAGGLYSLYNDSIYIGAATMSPLKIELAKPVTSFGWDILDARGQVIQSDAYDVPIAENQRAVVQSGDGLSSALLFDDKKGTTQSIYGYQDHSKTNFCMAPLGKSTIRFNGLYKGITITLRKEFVVVG